MKIFFSATLLLFLLTACAPDKEAGQTGASAAVKLWCEEAEAGASAFAVYFQFAEQKVKIANLDNCAPLLPGAFPERGIPDDALAAVGNAAEALYVLQKSDSLIVLRRTGTGEAAQPIVLFQDGKLQMLGR